MPVTLPPSQKMPVGILVHQAQNASRSKKRVSFNDQVEFDDKTTAKTKNAAKSSAVVKRSDSNEIAVPDKVRKASDITGLDKTKMTFCDPIMWKVAGIVTFVAIAALSSNPITVGLAAVALGLIALRIKKDWPNIKQQLVIKLNLIKDWLKPSYQYYNKIDDHVFIGALPLKNKNHLVDLYKRNVKTVISLAEQKEHENDSLLAKPLRGSDWKKVDVEFLHLQCPDYLPVPITIMDRGADIIKDHIQSKKAGKIYIHCNSGIERAPLLYMGYLIKHGQEMLGREITPDEAIKIVKKKRPCASLNRAQKIQLLDYYNALKLRSKG